MGFGIGVMSIAAAAALALFAASSSAQVFETDLQSDPKQDDWICLWPNPKWGAKPAFFPGTWDWIDPDAEQADATDRGGYLKVTRGNCDTPQFAVEPLKYYQVTFKAQSDARSYWAAQFYDDKGESLVSDDYSSFDASPKWAKQTFCFRARANAATVRMRVAPSSKPLLVDDITVVQVSRDHVLKWLATTYAQMPRVTATVPAGQDKLLPKTTAKLKAGQTLRVVMLGDSIINDTGNGCFELLVEKQYPSSRVELTHSVRGGTGCWYYRRPGHVQSYVLDHKPDLLIIGGISHRYSIDAIADVIDQVRAKSDPEILLLTGPVSPFKERIRQFLKKNPGKQDVIEAKIAAWPDRLEALATEKNCAYFDIRTAYIDYVDSSGHDHAWFMRDPVHANVRGRVVLGRLMQQYFAGLDASK